MIDAIAVIGDAGDSDCWSGTPYHFGQAARECGEPAAPWRLNLASLGPARAWWNAGQLWRGRGIGGYQYSRTFLDRAETSIPAALWPGRIVTFNQHFPRSQSVVTRGGRLVHYVDATFASFCGPGGLAEKLPGRVRQAARELEQENYLCSERVVTMARWAAESVIRDCGMSPDKVATILPGANLELPAEYGFPVAAGRAGLDRPVVLGFVGKDWKRKGLRFLLEVRAGLERMGMPAVVRCAGHCPAELARVHGLEYRGFIGKVGAPGRFLDFLAGCDVGCLFSAREPLGLSTLEFLRAGVPVAGFTVEGVADTVPPDAGFRFTPGATSREVAAALRDAFQDPGAVDQLRAKARAWSPFVTWERCVSEWVELLKTGTVRCPVQPWRGLESLSFASATHD